ncbi:MAG: long-chain-fatty-acid--CoA ligase [Candidatus Solibacter usitatus]|nr:long-chain-fatty-acid--CoA ligase [Candidatus Solibacter usitatus]
MNLPLTPLRCLERALDLFSHKTGVICGETSLTYAQFGERCQRLATALPALGVEAGDRVAYLSFNTHKLLEGYYGVVQAGAIVMPLNVRLSPGELIVILSHSGAKVLFYENDFASMVEHLRLECPGVLHFIGLDAPAYDELLASGRPQDADILAVDENSVAELFYTSGSTGTPKGVMLTHRNLYLHALGIATVVQDPVNTIDLHTIPLFHANGWGRPQTSTMLGFTQVMVRRFDPPAVFALIERHRATEMSVVPTMANMLLNSPALGTHDISSMKLIMLGGAASSPELVARMEAAFKCRVHAGYGLTETCPVITVARLKSAALEADPVEAHRRRAMAGWPIPGVKVRVADLYGKPVPRDGQTIGEIVARGDQVMLGYYNEPAATDAVIEDHWFHTGDMGVWDEEGYVHIVDRKKEIIISGGENISSLEVERAIFSHEAVLECAVVAAPDDEWGEVPAAVVVLKEGRTLSEEDLLTFLKTRLGKFKLPRVIEFTSEPLPKTGTGKIRKLALRERFWAGKEKRVQG